MVTYTGDMTFVADTTEEYDDYRAMFAQHPKVSDISEDTPNKTITFRYEVEVR